MFEEIKGKTENINRQLEIWKKRNIKGHLYVSVEKNLIEGWSTSRL